MAVLTAMPVNPVADPAIQTMVLAVLDTGILDLFGVKPAKALWRGRYQINTSKKEPKGG